MSNNLLKYTSKDYNSIYKDLIEAIPGITDLWTNTEDGDPGIILVKLMSALGDMLSYNMDKQALEYYSSTVTQRKNALKLFNLIGYKMHWYKSAATDVTITNSAIRPNEYKDIDKYINLKTQLNEGTIPNEDYAVKLKELYAKPTIDKNDTEAMTAYYEEQANKYNNWLNTNVVNLYTYINSVNSTLTLSRKGIGNSYYTLIPTTDAEYKTTPEYIINPGESKTLKAVEGYICSLKFSANQIRNNRFYLPESRIDEEYIWLECTNSLNTGDYDTVEFISKSDNILLESDGKIHFEFGVDEFDLPYIELSSYWNTDSENAKSFVLYYIRNNGQYGNISRDFLTTIQNTPSAKISISHPANNTVLLDSDGNVIAEPGRNPESPHTAYINSLNYVTTFNTIVTIYDFERFAKRQKGISNAFAVDGQRAKDLNELLLTRLKSKSLNQLKELANNPDSLKNADENTIIDYIYAKQQVNYSDTMLDDGTFNAGEYPKYGLNLHIVYGNFATEDSLGNPIADYAKAGKIPKTYYTYGIKTEGTTSIANMLDTELKDIKIVNVNPEYKPIRVFPWRCCGTIYLNNPVTEEVANNIIKQVINALTVAFQASNLTFGKKITYMDIINIVTNVSDKIRYFDAGLTDKNLIEFDNNVDTVYFNDISLMRYVQTFDENKEPKIKDSTGKSINNPYYKLLSVDSDYILKTTS